MQKYITVQDIKNNKIDLDNNGNVIIRNLPIYEIVNGNNQNYKITIENIKTKEIYESGIMNLIKI